MKISKIDIIINEVEKFPEPFLDEVLVFVQYLKQKMAMERMDTAIASESSLKKD